MRALGLPASSHYSDGLDAIVSGLLNADPAHEELVRFILLIILLFIPCLISSEVSLVVPCRADSSRTPRRERRLYGRSAGSSETHAAALVFWRRERRCFFNFAR